MSSSSSSQQPPVTLPQTQVADLLAQLPAGVRQTFTVAQIDALATALATVLGQRPAPHAVRFQATAPLWPGRGVYLALFLGNERRSRARLRREGQTRTTRLLAALGGVAMMAFGAVCAIYLVKSLAGINLMATSSPLHPLYALFIGH